MVIYGKPSIVYVSVGNLTVTVIFELMTFKSNRFVIRANCVFVEVLVEIHSAVHELSSSEDVYGLAS